jgi:membrane protein DedA with SNARE-associated domain
VAHLTDLLTTLITNLYIYTGLAGIVLAMAIESCCIPLPSEVVIPVAGLLLAQHKLLPGVSTPLGIFLIALAGSLGCLIGSIAAYGIGYKGGRPLMLKYGRYVLISQHDADIADRFFQRWGSATAFFSRLLPVVRTYISLPAGMTKMSFAKFCIYSFAGSFPWCLLLAYAGVVLGGNIAVIEPYYKSFEYVVIAAVVVLVVLYVWRHLRNDRRARAEHAAAEAAALQPPVNGFPQQSVNNGLPQYQQQPLVNGATFPAQPQQQWNQTPQNWQQPQGPSQPQPPRR